MYHVYLDQMYLYGVSGVEESAEREVAVYNGIGQGDFSIPASEKLRKWVITCNLTDKEEYKGRPDWQSAGGIFKGLDRMIASKKPARLLITSPNRRLSERVLLESYSKVEEYPGAYEVTIKVMEYVSVGIRTDDVPYIERPGKIPEPPKTVVFGSNTTPYGLQMWYQGGTKAGPNPGGEPLSFYDPETMQRYTNPVMIPEGKEVVVKDENAEKKIDYIATPMTVAIGAYIKASNLSKPSEGKPLTFKAIEDAMRESKRVVYKE